MLKESTDLFSEFVDNGGKLNNVMYGLMFNVYRKCGDYQSAIQLHKQAIVENMELNMAAYTPLLECYFFYDKLEEILLEIKKAGMPLNIIMFNELIRLRKYKKDLNGALDLFEKLKRIISNLPKRQYVIC
eukprot:UN27085